MKYEKKIKGIFGGQALFILGIVASYNGDSFNIVRDGHSSQCVTIETSKNMDNY